jgi:hypothetical protein
MLEPSNGQLAPAEMLTIADGAKRLATSVRSVRHAIRTGVIRGTRVFGRYVVPAAEIDRLLNQPPPPTRRRNP